MVSDNKLDQKLTQRLLLSRPTDDDRLMLSDAVMLAALLGEKPLGAAQRKALQESPLTLRRFRHLAIEWRAGQSAQAGSPPPPPPQPPQVAANDADWHGSSGLLRAADSGAALAALPTDDQYWVLHFIADADGWQVILSLDPAAPFAARLLEQGTPLRVADGAGEVILQGALDADGECEGRWPFAQAPSAHFQTFGAGFVVEPL